MGLGSLLYAVLTGMWPGSDHPYLPAAPLADGQPRRPRQVRAGVPSAPGRHRQPGARHRRPGREPFTSTRELAQALVAVIPPTPIPPALAQARREAGPDAVAPGRSPGRSSRATSARPTRTTTGTAPIARSRPSATVPPATAGRPGRGVAVVAVIALVAIVGLSAAAFKYLTRPARVTRQSGQSSTHTTTPVAQTVVLTPVVASGFDALHTTAQDPTDENS